MQNQFSPTFRSSRPEIDVCEELGLAFLPWSPLGGLSSAKELGDKHAAFAEIAEARGVSPQRVALAWELAQSPCVIPIPGAKRPESITDSAAATDLELTDDEAGTAGRASVEVDDHGSVVGGALAGPLVAVDERARDARGQRRASRGRSRCACRGSARTAAGSSPSR